MTTTPLSMPQSPLTPPHGHAEMLAMMIGITRARSLKHSGTPSRMMRSLWMHQPGVLSAIAVLQIVRRARSQVSTSSLMLAVRHHQQRRSLTPLQMIGLSARPTLNAAAAPVGPAVVMITTQAPAVAMQGGGSHAFPIAGARVPRIAVVATDDRALLHTGEPLSQRSVPVRLSGYRGSLCTLCRRHSAARCAAPLQDAAANGWVPTPNCV